MTTTNNGTKLRSGETDAVNENVYANLTLVSMFEHTELESGKGLSRLFFPENDLQVTNLRVCSWNLKNTVIKKISCFYFIKNPNRQLLSQKHLPLSLVLICHQPTCNIAIATAWDNSSTWTFIADTIWPRHWSPACLQSRSRLNFAGKPVINAWQIV